MANNSMFTSLAVKQRVIGHYKGKYNGPTLIFFGGIHGNEPAGVSALKKVFLSIKENVNDFKGELIALSGNLNALSKNIRFQEEDLNRIWADQRLESLDIKTKLGTLNAEEKEMQELYAMLLQILDSCEPPFYFIDLHTTSSDTIPFLIINDSLLNRKFTKNYPLPVILGIEEYLNGALLSYLNELGYVSIGFESGQHTSEEAVENAKNFIWYTLILTGFYNVHSSIFESLKQSILKAGNYQKKFFEIYFQRLVSSNESFQMQPGYTNFQDLTKGEIFAHDHNGAVISAHNTQIFMPLYQKSGNEAYYLIRPIPMLFLTVSKYVRRFRLDSVLTILPGVTRDSNDIHILRVNKRVARFLAKPIFHLLGYRARSQGEHHLILKSREYNSKLAMYKKAPWFT